MPKKVVVLFTLLTFIACFLSYKLGSTPIALAQSRAAQLSAPTLPAAPSTWVLTSSQPESINAIVTRAAGGSGVQHVATCISASVKSDTGTGEYPLALELLDGSNVLMEWQVNVPENTQTGVNYLIFSQCDLNVVGSANTAMTLQFNINNAPMTESVNLVGYDAQ